MAITNEINDLRGWLLIQRDAALHSSQWAGTLRERRYWRGQYDAFCHALAAQEYAQPGGAELGAAHVRAREEVAPSEL
jgi:hypothetical protein